jgi:hypothetical protein
MGIDEVVTTIKAGNSMNLNHNVSVHNEFIPFVSNSEQTLCADCEDGEIPGTTTSTCLIGTQPAKVGGEVGESLIGEVSKHGNSALSIGQTASDSKQSATSGSPQANNKWGDRGGGSERFVLENTVAKTVKRCKCREGSVDEDSSSRAEHLKAKKNLDDPSTSKSKSFLSFSDSKIVDNIASLGVLIRNDIERSIVSMREVELNRLLQTPLK